MADNSINTNINSIDLENIIFNYLTVNTVDEFDNDINETDNERLLINQYDNDKFSLIAGKNGVAIKTTREIARNATNVGLYVDDNVIITGTLYTCNINILGESFTNTNTEKILEAINNKTTPLLENGNITIYNNGKTFTITNYYLTHYLTIGNLSQSLNNLSPLNISRKSDNNINKIQFSISNEGSHPETNEKNDLLLGIIGDGTYSPAIIYTNNRNLEFHISQTKENINLTYNNGIDYNSNIPSYMNKSLLPAMLIDISRGVCINSEKSKNISYNTHYLSNTEITKLNVDGLCYFENIITKDNITKSNLHLDNIYVRREGLTLNANQIYSGIFNGNFIFNSNVLINTLNIDNKLNVYNNADLCGTINIKDSSTVINDFFNIEIPSYFNNNAFFSCNIITDTLNIKGNLQKNGCNINITEIETIILNLDSEIIKEYIPIDSLNRISSNIYNYILENGNSNLNILINNISDISKLEIISNIDFFFNYDFYIINDLKIEIIDYIKYNGLSNISNYLSNIDGISNTIEIIDYYNIQNISNLIIDSNNLYNKQNIIDIIKNEDNSLNLLSNIISDKNVFNNISIINTIINNVNSLHNLSNFDNTIDITQNIIIEIHTYGYSNILNNFLYDNIHNFIIETINFQNSYLYTKNQVSSNIYQSLLLGNYSDFNGLKGNLENFLDMNRLILDNSINIEIKNEIISNGLLNIENYVDNNENIKYKVELKKRIKEKYTFSNINLLIIDNSELISKEISNYLKINSFNGLYNYIFNLDISSNIANIIYLSLLENYQNKTILTYAIKDTINIDGSNITIPGRLGIGIENDSYNNMLSIYRRSDNIQPQIQINDYIFNDKLIATIGHNRGYLNSEFNTLCIGTNNLYQNHDIAFYSGQLSSSLQYGYSKHIPNFIIKHSIYNPNNRKYESKIGINTFNPRKELDIIGDFIIEGNLYKLYEEREYKIINLLETDKNVIFLDKVQNDIVFNIKKLEIDGGYINSSFGYYENNERIIGFNKGINGLYVNTDNINIGYNSKNTPIYNAALQIRNAKINNINNSVIRIFESITESTNYNRYSGIDICRFTSDINRKWYLYNIHDGSETFKIGFQENNNSVNDIIKIIHTNSKNQLYLNSTSNDQTIINGSLLVKGDIDVTQTYRINGIELTSNHIHLSTFTNTSLITDELIINKNDILIQGNNIVTTVNTNSSYYIGEKSSYFVKYMNLHGNNLLQNGLKKDSKLVIFDEPTLLNKNIPITSFKTRSYDGQNGETKIRLGILSKDFNTNEFNNDLNNDLNLKKYIDMGMKSINNDLSFILSMKDDITHNTVFEIENKFNLLHFKFGKNILITQQSSFFHIYDNDNTNILHLESENDISILFQSMTSNLWTIKTNDKFIINNNNNDLIVCYNQNVGINVINPIYTLDIENKANEDGKDKGCLRLKNVYERELELKNMENFKFCNLNSINFENIIKDNKSIIKLNYNTYDLDNHTFEKIKDGYLCNFIINYSNIIYEIFEDISFQTTLDHIYYKDCLTNKWAVVSIPYTDNISIINTIINLNITNILQKYDNISYQINFLTVPLFTSNFFIYTSNSIQITYQYNSFFNLDNYINIISSYSYENTSDNKGIDKYIINIYIGDSDLSNNIYDIFDVNIQNYEFNNSCNIYLEQNFYIQKNFHKIINNIDIYGIYTLSTLFNLNLIEGLYSNIYYDETSNIISYLTNKYDNIELITEDISNIHTFNLFETNISIISKFSNITYQTFISDNTIGEFYVSYKFAKPHIILDNYIINSNNKLKHHIYSYDGNFQIFLEDPYINYMQIFKINKYGEVNIKSLKVTDLIITGDIYDEYSIKLREKLVFDLNIIESSNNVYIKSEKQILINTSESYENANMIIHNIKNFNDNVLMLTTNQSQCYLYFKNTIYNQTNIFKLGTNSNSFSLIYNDIIALEIKYNNSTSSFDFDFHGNFSQTISSIDLGDIHINNDYINNENTNTSNVIDFQKNNISKMKIENDRIICSTSFSCLSLYQTSDIKIKNNVCTIENALYKISTLTGIVYHNILTNNKETGLIAQEVKKILPEAVSSIDNLLHISYGNLMGLIVEGIKELKNEIVKINILLSEK